MENVSICGEGKNLRTATYDHQNKVSSYNIQSLPVIVNHIRSYRPKLHKHVGENEYKALV